MGFLQQLQKRWGVNSLFRVIMILLVFTCTGFSVLVVEDWISVWLGIPKDLPDWLRVLFFLVITLPIYQIVLLVYGFIFGQFRFFWEFEKRFFGRLISVFRKPKA